MTRIGNHAASPITAIRPIATTDVGRIREERRRNRVAWVGVILGIPLIWLSYRAASGRPVVVTDVRLPYVDPFLLIVGVFFAVMILTTLGTTMFTGRSPHVLYRPEQIDIRLADVKGIDTVREEVERSVNLFLAHRAFAHDMGGTPRRGVLFEGLPGTGKTYLAKAMAREAGVPFLFVSATSFQSMFYGATARKIRSYFKALRRTAAKEGGAIGFIEEIDAIAMARAGLSGAVVYRGPGAGQAGFAGLEGCLSTSQERLTGTPAGGVLTNRIVSEGTGGVVNELLVQMQSFDQFSDGQKVRAWLIERINLFLPLNRQLKLPTPPKANILLIAATNRADNLDPALLRPGRFDRCLSFEPPNRAGRRELVDFFLSRKAHDTSLAFREVRDGIAAVTAGYTPVMLEHLFDEALINALRRGSTAMSRADVEAARLTEEVGMGQPVGYTAHETKLIATHEAGHATVAHLVAPRRRLEVLSIIKRRDALGMLAHADSDEVFTRSRTELRAMIAIAMAGQVAEELFFGDVSTGPAGDLQAATAIAAQMVGAAGMGDSLISLAAVTSSQFNDTNLVGRVLADAASRAEVERLLVEQKGRARWLLEQNVHVVLALRDALLERHELVGSEIVDVIKNA